MLTFGGDLPHSNALLLHGGLRPPFFVKEWQVSVHCQAVHYLYRSCTQNGKGSMDTQSNKAPHARSIEGFAQRLGVCRRTVYNQINAGMLETTKIGKRRIITEQQEQNYLERCRA